MTNHLVRRLRLLEEAVNTQPVFTSAVCSECGRSDPPTPAGPGPGAAALSEAELQRFGVYVAKLRGYVLDEDQDGELSVLRDGDGQPLQDPDVDPSTWCSGCGRLQPGQIGQLLNRRELSDFARILRRMRGQRVFTHRRAL